MKYIYYLLIYNLNIYFKINIFFFQNFFIFQKIKKLNVKYEKEYKQQKETITNLELKMEKLNKDSTELMEKKLMEKEVIFIQLY